MFTLQNCPFMPIKFTATSINKSLPSSTIELLFALRSCCQHKTVEKEGYPDTRKVGRNIGETFGQAQGFEALDIVSAKVFC